MPRFFYHGTTQKGYEEIQKTGAIQPQSGNTYTDKIFLSGNDTYARRVIRDSPIIRRPMMEG